MAQKIDFAYTETVSLPFFKDSWFLEGEKKMRYYMILKVLISLVLGICTVTDLLWRKIWLPVLVVPVPMILICIVRLGNKVESHILCGFLCLMFFGGISVVTGGQMEKGDGLVLSVLGLALSLWQYTVVLFFSFSYSFLAALFLVIVRKKKKSYRMPFIPFVMVGYLTLLLAE